MDRQGNKIFARDVARRTFSEPILLRSALKTVPAVEGYGTQVGNVLCVSFKNTTFAAFTGALGQTALLTFADGPAADTNHWTILGVELALRTPPVALENFNIGIYGGRADVAGGVDAAPFRLDTLNAGLVTVGEYHNTGVIDRDITLIAPVCSVMVSPTYLSIQNNNYHKWSGIASKATDSAGNKVLCVGASANTVSTWDISIFYCYDSNQ